MARSSSDLDRSGRGLRLGCGPCLGGCAATLVLLVALAASMLGLSHAVRTIPLGTAYAVWVGIGAALTVAWGVVSGTESFSWAKVLLIAGLVACVVGLNLVGETH